MYKPNSLRAHLSALLPDLRQDPDKLLIFVDNGHIVAMGSESRSFEYRYQLNLIFTDFTGDEDTIMVPLIDWLATHQPDLLNNHATREKAIRFDVDYNNHQSVDISLEIDLSESVKVRQSAQAFHITHVGEPTLAPAYSAPYWTLYKGENKLVEWAMPDPDSLKST
jgi:hypothetical protein